MCDHRSTLTLNRPLIDRLQREKEKVRDLDAKKNTLITERYKAILKGVEGLKELHNVILQVQTDRDKTMSERDELAAFEEDIRTCLLIGNDTEFEWAARVIDRTRVGLAINASLELDHAEVVKAVILEKEESDKKHFEEIESLKSQLSARNTKYLMLKKKLRVLLSNLQNEAVRAGDDDVKSTMEMICDIHGIEPLHIEPSFVPPDEECTDVSDTDAEDGEGTESEEEDEDEVDIVRDTFEDNLGKK
ncbi:uncharacterized protein LOC113323628 isoform X2 [Papaver somniferum]|nr:uncharacterized protein LOC113323628 isoform X2 [Papaver somniferum]